SVCRDLASLSWAGMPTILSRPAPPPSTRLLQILAQLAEMPLLGRVHKPLGAALQLFPPRADLPRLDVADLLVRRRRRDPAQHVRELLHDPAGHVHQLAGRRARLRIGDEKTARRLANPLGQTLVPG